MAWADQMLQYLHEWLLDEEQKELLQLNPWDLFILHASACLCHIHLARPNSTVGSSEASRNTIALASKEPGDSDAGCIIKMHWEALGIRHAPLAAAIADVCTAADHGSVPRDMRVDGSSINAPLISAAIGMAKALSLKSPDTTKQVCAYLPAAGLSAVGHYNEAISITGVGGHPYLANTIQMKLECRDPELHRALKHHERSVQRQLDHYNRVASPRFLYSDVL